MPTIQTLKTFWESVLYAYSQIFFSKHKGLAYLVFFGSFVNWEVGLLGMAGVVFTNLAARWFGFDRHTTDEGLFGLNSLLVCLALAVGFDINGQFWVVFFIVCLFTLFLSVMLSKVLGVWGLPMLSLPFLFSVWVVTLAVRHYSSLELNSSGIYVINHLYSLGGTSLVKMYESMNNLPIPGFVDDYLKSLGAIIFQYNLITGTLIALGLFIGSRISFSLSLIGFGTGYLYYYWVEGDVSQLHYSHIGFNFILCSIALGGFFFIPSVKTYLLTAVMVPIVALLIAATAAILLPFGLPVFSLPFVFTVLLVLISVQGGVRPKDFVRVIYQSYSPEKNLYGYRASVERFIE